MDLKSLNEGHGTAVLMSLVRAKRDPLRVLDLDLDFFLYGAAHGVDSADSRLDPEEYPPWPLDHAIDFLVEQCLLTERRPGFVVEHHNEIFYRWGEALERGQMTAPLEVVHVDAHADLGVGDTAYAYVMSELAFEPVEDRYEILRARRPQSVRKCSVWETTL